jgi:chromosome condensin MukBEF ATPase and DNA-binding subunit MukB
MRQREILLIREGKEQLEDERQQLVQIRQSIDQEKAELQQTIPLARQLLAMKIDITNFIPYVEILNDYSQAHNTDLTTAAFEIIGHFKAYKELKTLEDSVEEAGRINQQLKAEKQQIEQQLAMLHMSTAKYQNAIGALNDLQSAGFSTNQIAELIGPLDVEPYRCRY